MPSLWKNHLLRSLEEDGQPFDFTAQASQSPSSQKNTLPKPRNIARIIAKEAGVFFGSQCITAAQSIAKEEFGETWEIQHCARNSSAFQPNEEIAVIHAAPRSLHALERGILNLLSFACGITTETSKTVKATESLWSAHHWPCPRITPTRKTLPYYRDISVAACSAGGARPHRLALSSGILIKENHIRTSGGIVEAIEKTRAMAPHGLRIEIEVTNKEELQLALHAKADIILLDNFSHSQLKQLNSDIFAEIKRPGQPIIEVSGGISAASLDSVCFPFIDVISIGQLTKSVVPIDFSWLIDPV